MPLLWRLLIQVQLPIRFLIIHSAHHQQIMSVEEHGIQREGPPATSGQCAAALLLIGMDKENNKVRDS